MNFNIFDYIYDYEKEISIILIIIFTALLIFAMTNSKSSNLLKNQKEYIDKGYEETIVIIDNYGNPKEILIKKDSKLLDMLKKELEKDK